MRSTDAAQTQRYFALQAAQTRRGLTEHPVFPPRNVNGAWDWGPMVAALPGSLFSPLADGWRLRRADRTIEPNASVPTLSDQIDTHWGLNLLAGYNSSIAFLLLSDETYLSRL